ncbi:hypothetical protein WR43_22380, partial [Mycolicibacter arupensis]
MPLCDPDGMSPFAPSASAEVCPGARLEGLFEELAELSGQRNAIAVHLDVEQQIGALRLGPLLPDAERQYLTCDATCEVWFERDGAVIGCVRSTRNSTPAHWPAHPTP